MALKRRYAGLVTAGIAATLLFVGAAAMACDIPIYKAASTDWPPEIYSLYYCTQDGLKANADAEKLFDTGLKSWMEFVNLDRIKIDVKRPIFGEDKEFLAKRGIRTLPYAVLTDKDGNAIAGAGGPLTEETWKTLEAATKPAGPFRVLAYTSPRGGPVVPDPKAATPIPLTVIDFNQATDEQLAQATTLGIDRYRVPYSVLLGKDDKKLAEVVESKLDTAAWAHLQRTAAPAGPFKATVFTKTELGAIDTAKAPFPVTTVDLDKADKDALALAQKLKVVNLPFVAIVSPRGTEIATFESAVNEPRLREVVDSPKRGELVKQLSGSLIACVLFVKSKDAKADAALLGTAKDAIKRAERMFAGKIGLVEVDPGDNREDALFRTLRLPRDGKEPVIYTVFGRGKVLDVPPLKGKVTGDDVVDVLQIVMQNCSCVITPESLGEDLLLNWPPPKDRK